MKNEYFSIKKTPFVNMEWIYVDAKKVLLIVFGYTIKTNSLVLIRQYRPPINNYVISAPMGAFPDTSLEELTTIAAKEAEGETGHKVLEIKYFLSIDRSPGLTNEQGYIFLVKYSEEYGTQVLHEDEIIEVLRVPKNQISDYIYQCRQRGDHLDSSILLTLTLPSDW